MSADTTALRRHVETLAAAPRPPGSRQHRRALGHIEASLRGAGWRVRREPFAEVLAGVNLVAERDRSPADRSPLFIVGAHYDSRPETPGADDNASAVAALLQLASLLRDEAERSAVHLQLVAYDEEERGTLGSSHHADEIRRRELPFAGMVSLEMLGYRDPAPGSQNVPARLEGLYPSTGDFIGVIGNERSRALLDRFSSAMREIASLRVESLVLPGNGESLPPARLSDHAPFWDRGFPALMITDTSFFRNPHYHQPSDTPETLDYEFLALVTDGVAEAVRAVLRQG
jgi:aminopeptidase YwaD